MGKCLNLKLSVPAQSRSERKERPAQLAVTQRGREQKSRGRHAGASPKRDLESLDEGGLFRVLRGGSSPALGHHRHLLAGGAPPAASDLQLVAEGQLTRASLETKITRKTSRASPCQVLLGRSARSATASVPNLSSTAVILSAKAASTTPAVLARRLSPGDISNLASSVSTVQQGPSLRAARATADRGQTAPSLGFLPCSPGTRPTMLCASRSHCLLGSAASWLFWPWSPASSS